MAKHAFAAYKITIAEHGKPKQTQRVGDLDHQGLDILELVHDAVKDLDGNPTRDDDSQNYLAVESRTPDGHSPQARELRLRLNYGTYGTPGAIQDVHDPTNRRTHSHTEAAITHFRNLLVAHPSDPFLILMSERYRGRGATTMFTQHLRDFVNPRLRHLGLHMSRPEGIADSAAFQRFLQRARLAELEIVDLRPNSDLFSDANNTPMARITHTAKPVGKERWLPDPLRDKVLKHPMSTNKLFGLREVEPGTPEHREVRVTLNDGKQQRKVVLSEEEKATPLVYLLAEDTAQVRPSDTDVYAQMRATCDEICHHLRVDSD
jgi:hypothetical protein